MQSSPEATAPEWVTATQAVALLQVSERSVRRFARLLPDTARRKRQGVPVEFRLSALSELMGREESTGEAPGAQEQAQAGEDRRAPDTKSPAPDTAGQGELIEQLRSEVAFLRSALEREQLTTQALASRLEDSDKRLAAVLAGTGRLRIEPPGLASDSQSEDSGPGKGITPPDPEGRPWWQFWRR